MVVLVSTSNFTCFWLEGRVECDEHGTVFVVRDALQVIHPIYRYPQIRNGAGQREMFATKDLQVLYRIESDRIQRWFI